MDVQHLTATLQKAAAHKGTAFVEIYQNCKIFNDGVFEYATDKSVKADNLLYLEHGKPLIFGKNRDKGIRLNGLRPEVVKVGVDCGPDDLLIHDETLVDQTVATMYSRMVGPEFPEVMGVYRNVRRPCYEELLGAAIEADIKKKGPGTIADLFKAEDIWTVE